MLHAARASGDVSLHMATLAQAARFNTHRDLPPRKSHRRRIARVDAPWRRLAVCDDFGPLVISHIPLCDGVS